MRETLLDQQAALLGLPLRKVPLPFPCPNGVYEAAMEAACRGLVESGVQGVVFGDLFLRDVRAYRERRLEPTGLHPHFPLWGRDTRSLAREMIRGGIRSVVVALDPKRVPREIAGREFDESLLGELPPRVDPCGENGEFHTFVWDGPLFPHAVGVRRGRRIERDGAVYQDLLPNPPRRGEGVPTARPTPAGRRRRGSPRSP